MKKLLLSIIFVLLVLTTFSSCKSDSQTEDANNVAIGIIETTGYKSKSYIHFFDKDLKFLYKKVFNYASLSEPFDRPITKNGAHVGGQNSHKIGIALMGHLDPSFDINASSSRPTEKQIVSLQRLVAWLDYMYGIDSVKKHKDLNPNTICPGQYAEEDLASKYIFR